MSNTPLTIIQYNTHRSRDVVMADFLAKPGVIQADIIAVQEPWENPYNDTTYHPLKQTHELLFPSSLETGSRARVCLYISKNLTGWTHYAHSEFCQEVRLQTRAGQICFFNIYNECGTTGTVEFLSKLLEGSRKHIMIAGDFNLHNPAWGGIEATQDPGSDKLIELCDEADLDLWLEPGTITRDQNGEQTTIDLFFGTPGLTERLVVCELALDCHADSDHLPIRVLLDINAEPTVEVKRRLWKAMDTEKFDIFVADNLPMPPRLTTLRQVDDAVNHLIDIVQRGAHESTPWAKPCPRANPSWTKECGEAVKHSRRMFRRYLATHGEEDWQTYKLARNQKGKVIKAALRRGFRSFIEEAVDQGPQGLWRVAKWARSRGQQQGSTMPALKTADGFADADTDTEKVKLLRKVFFPQPPEADLSDIQQSHASHREQYQLPPINDTEVRAAIKKAPPNKAPGYDALPNQVWRVLAKPGSRSEKRFIPLLTAIFDACVRIGHNPQHFQTSVTVTLRKAGPRDYRVPKSYRPVALLNTLGKILEAIVATRIAWCVEEYGLLPKTHLGGRKGISVDHAIQLILARVYQAWGEGKTASMLLLDVAGAYDMVSHERLLYNMRQMGLGALIPWVQSFLTGRSTRIKLPNGYLSEAFPTPTGIPQGSPISPILFLLFNAPLVRACTLRGLHYGESEAYGWVDDVCILAISNSYEENVQLLEKALQRAASWASKHAAKFAPDKFELIHFTNPAIKTRLPRSVNNTIRTIHDTTQRTPNTNTSPQDIDIWEVPDDPAGHDGMPVIIPGDPTPTILPPSDTAKYLGVWLDKRLSFTIHRKKILAKGAGSLEALRGISGSTWGSSLIAMRKVYQAVIIPQMLWGLSAWYCPAARAMPRGDLDKLTHELTKIQKRATILISGAFRGTAGAALDTELFITPIKLRIQQIVEETAIRILTGPQWACPQIAKATKTRKPSQRRLGGWSPTEAIAQKTPLRLQPGEKWEEKQAFVLAPWEARMPCFIENQEAALESHNCIYKKAVIEGNKDMIFTDGSGFAGHIGASMASLQHGVTSQRRYLGTDSQSTVYAAELSGIEIALAKTKKESTEIDLNGQPTAREVIIFSDSQAAIQALQNPQRPSGQYVLRQIYNHVRAIRSQNQPTNITIRWIPAHVGVDGNEFADEEAKGAALLGAGIGVATEPDKPIIRLAAAAKRAVRQRIRERWEKQWERETTSAPTKRLVQAPNKKTLRLYEGLSKPQCAILIQMRTMRIGLRHFLFKIKAAETDRCSCDEGSQTPKHILMQCPQYIIPRTKLWEQLDKIGIGITEIDYDKIMSNPQATRYVVNFMHRTGLLQQFQYVTPEDDNDEPIGLAAMDLGVEDDGY
jgi:ribonuclease HI